MGRSWIFAVRVRARVHKPAFAFPLAFSSKERRSRSRSTKKNGVHFSVRYFLKNKVFSFVNRKSKPRKQFLKILEQMLIAVNKTNYIRHKAVFAIF